MQRLLLVSALFVSLAGCRDGLGKRCMETADCKSGLVCILPPGGTPQTGGICSEPSDLSAPTFDLTLIEPVDAGIDSSTEEPDLRAPSDLSSVDDSVQ